VKSDWHAVVEMRTRDRSAIELLGVEYGEVARVAVFIEDVGEQIPFALARP
jgi:hypothetical protein